MAAIVVGKSSHKPNAQYRVLATDWESETSTECWTEDLESARVIAAALQVRDVSVQIDRVVNSAG